MSKYKVMLGSDPELLLNKTVYMDQKPFPIIGLLGHGKHDPLHIDDSGFRTLQEDNVALEYTTHPTSTKEDWVEEQTNMYDHAVKVAEGFGLGVFKNIASISFDRVMLQSDAAKTFGCEATWNAFTNSENPAPPSGGQVRSVGGHVHISYENPNDEQSMEICKILDVLYLKNIDSLSGDNEIARRELYGKAGEIRLKSYGVEWRVLSSYWVHFPETRNAVWDLVEEAFDLYDEGYRFNTERYAELNRHINTTSSHSNYKRFLNKVQVKTKSKTTGRKLVSA